MLYRPPTRRPGEKLGMFLQRLHDWQERYDREKAADDHSAHCTCDICDARAYAADAENELRKDR